MTGRLRVRMFVGGALADEEWLDVDAGDARGVLDALLVYHLSLTERADAEGRPWLIEVFDPDLPPGRAYFRMGTDGRGMRLPVPVVSQEQLEAEVDRRYGTGPAPVEQPAVPLPGERPLLDLLEAAPLLRISRTTAYELARSGEFPVEVLKIGKLYKVRTADVRRYLGLDMN